MPMKGCWLFALWLLGPGGAWADEATPMHAARVSPHAWYVQGAAAMGSRANDNFIWNAH